MSMADNRGARTKRKIASGEMKARVTRWSSDEIADWLTSRPAAAPVAIALPTGDGPFVGRDR